MLKSIGFKIRDTLKFNKRYDDYILRNFKIVPYAELILHMNLYSNKQVLHQ